MHAIVTVVPMANNILLRKSGGLEKNKALWWVGAIQRRQQQRERRWRRNREELTRTKCLNNRKRFLRADLNHTRLQIYPVIGLRGMDSTSTAIFYFVQGGLYDRSERRSPPPSSSLLLPHPHSLQPSVIFPISSQDKFQIPRSYFWSSLLYRGT